MEKNISTEDADNVLLVDVKDKIELFNIYMPFIAGGALFIKTQKSYSLGDEVFLLIKLIDELKKYHVAGKVVWITPSCAQGGRAAGIGVQLQGEEGDLLRNKMDTYLAGISNSDRLTDTM